MIKTLRRKFILIAMLSVTAVLLLIVGSINVSNYVTVLQDADLRLQYLSETGGEFIPPDQKEDLPPQEEPQTDENAWREAEAGMTKPDRNGFFFDKKGRLSAETPFDTRFFTVTIQDGSVTAVNTGRIAAVDEATAESMALTLYEKGKTGGLSDHFRYRADETDGAVRYLFVDCSRELNTFYSFLTASLLVSVLGLGLVFLLVLFFSKKALSPVEESLQKQKRFITDASHELKTPMAVISAANEVIEIENGESEWTQSITKQIGRLTSLTEKLVMLTRMDEETYRPAIADFDLSAAVRETVESFEAVAQIRHRTLVTEIADGVTCSGDEAGIRQVVSLLTDNALKYSNENGTIRVSLKKSGKNAVLTMENTVDAIEKGDKSVFFERFYRADASRNSKTGGHGIGLSVAEAIVRAHKGKITANAPDDRHVVFTVVL